MKLWAVSPFDKFIVLAFWHCTMQTMRISRRNFPRVRSVVRYLTVVTALLKSWNMLRLRSPFNNRLSSWFKQFIDSNFHRANWPSLILLSMLWSARSIHFVPIFAYSHQRFCCSSSAETFRCLSQAALHVTRTEFPDNNNDYDTKPLASLAPYPAIGANISAWN